VVASSIAPIAVVTDIKRRSHWWLSDDLEEILRSNDQFDQINHSLGGMNKSQFFSVSLPSGGIQKQLTPQVEILGTVYGHTGKR